MALAAPGYFAMTAPAANDITSAISGRSRNTD